MILNTDGGSRGNPGPAAIGIVVRNDQNDILLEDGKFIGVSTNNDAEYSAIIHGLETALTYFDQNEDKIINCFLDSELVVKQLNGQYKVKHPKMAELYKKVKELEKNYTKVTYTHVLRHLNKEADVLVNKVLDAQ